MMCGCRNPCLKHSGWWRCHLTPRIRHTTIRPNLRYYLQNSKCVEWGAILASKNFSGMRGWAPRPLVYDIWLDTPGIWICIPWSSHGGMIVIFQNRYLRFMKLISESMESVCGLVIVFRSSNTGLLLRSICRQRLRVYEGCITVLILHLNVQATSVCSCPTLSPLR